MMVCETFPRNPLFIYFCGHIFLLLKNIYQLCSLSSLSSSLLLSYFSGSFHHLQIKELETLLSPPVYFPHFISVLSFPNKRKACTVCTNVTHLLTKRETDTNHMYAHTQSPL